MSASEGQIDRGGRAQPRRLRTAGVVAVVVLILAVGGWGVHGLTIGEAQGPSAGEGAPAGIFSGPSWFGVTKRSFDLNIVASGELDAKQKTEIKCMVDGTTTITDIIPEGTEVKEGDVLVRLADDDIRDKIEQQILTFEKAKADKITSEQEVDIQKNQADSDLKASEVKLALAELNMAKWQNGDVPQTRRNMQLDLEKAKRTLVMAKRDVELSKQLFEEKFISLTDLEKDQIAEIEAENGLSTADLNIKVYDDYTKPTDEKKNSSDVDQAKAEVERTKRKNQSEIEKAMADLDSKVRTFKIHQERLEKLQEQLRSTIVKAPQKGLVVYSTSVGPANRRNAPMIQGRQVKYNETMIILPDTRQMVAGLKVNEALVAEVRINQPVTLTIDARPDKPVMGKVFTIGVMAEDGGWMNPDLREYSVKVDLPPETVNLLKPAMRCTGEITVGRVEDALAVPVQAIFAEGDQRYCYVPASTTKVRKQAVTLGRASETYAEIVKGLSEGDKVLLRRPRAGELAE